VRRIAGKAVRENPVDDLALAQARTQLEKNYRRSCFNGPPMPLLTSRVRDRRVAAA
jgi:hypothetical protein